MAIRANSFSIIFVWIREKWDIVISNQVNFTTG